MVRKKSFEQLFEELVERFIPEIANAFRAGIADVVDRAILRDVVRAIELGDAERAFKVLGYSEAAMRPLTASLERAFEAGGVTVGQTFPRRLVTPSGPTVYRFDVRNSRAEKWLRETSASMVTNIGEGTRVSVRNVISEGVRDGRNPRNIALDIVGRVNRKTGLREGGIVGLNSSQERAVAAMRRDLENLDPNYFTRTRRATRFDDIIQEMFNGGKVDAETINKMTGQYKNSLLQLRGETIARDGAIEALNRSEYEALKQAQELGAMGKNGVKRAWDSSGPDGRTRPSHLAMDGTIVGLDEAFVFPNGVTMMHPQDRSLAGANNAKDLAKETINCRCRVRTIVDWLSDLD